MARELLLMSPYTPPAQYALMLGADVTSCWLNAWAALWHPAALRHGSGPPRWIGPYDQNDPGPEQIVAMPEVRSAAVDAVISSPTEREALRRRLAEIETTT